jgi:hypothetical protein
MLCSPKAVLVGFEAFQKRNTLGLVGSNGAPAWCRDGVLQVIKSDVVGGVEG